MKSRSLLRTEHALEAIEVAGDEGRRIFTRVYADGALAAARAADERASRGITLGPLDGAVVSVKDLFDIAGEPTTAGSAVLRKSKPADSDAIIVQRLRAAGAVIIGKTNMTEFAFSGIGINPHYGTPGNGRDVTRIPGGSSSGAGVAVALNMSEISIGSDTGGSVRIPSALNGVSGFKPTQNSVSRRGAYPLSFSLDTIGPLARSVLDCAKAHSILSGKTWSLMPARQAKGLRISVPRGLLFTNADPEVLAAFEHVIESLSRAGARVTNVAWDDWFGAPFKLQEEGTLIAAEAAYIHAQLMVNDSDAIDPLVRARISRGSSISAAHYIGVQQARQRLQHSLDMEIADSDVMMLPTVPLIAPRIDSLAEETAFNQANMLMLRNPSVFNFYDLPAMSLPIQRAPSQLPVGLMVVGKRSCDQDLLAICIALQTQIDLLKN